MRVLESLVVAKTGDPAACEDRIVETPHFIAVMDGATDKTGVRYEGMAGGRFAVEVLADALRALDPAATARDCVDALSERLRSELSGTGQDDEPDRPNAAVAVVSRDRCELWRVGDVSFAIDGTPHVARKRIDAVVADARAARLAAELLLGESVEALLADDPGREMVLPLLRAQWIFRNRDAADGYAYGSIDGTPVPASLIEIHSVRDADELVICTDGYPTVRPSLEDAEHELRQLLADDPLRIRPPAGTKGVRPGNESFDDRAYVRLRVD